jgi:fumarate reductase flavoprotein subunit
MVSGIKQNANLVVIGGGGAGLAAAVAAAENGVKNIIVLEKRNATGGASAMASGLFGADSPAQKRQAIIADKDDLYKRVINWALYSVNPRIVRSFINKSGDTVRWLEDKGIYFYCVPHSPRDDPLTWHVPKGNGAEIMQVLAEECRKLGVEIYTGTPAKKILQKEDGSLEGIVYQREDNDYTIETNAAVIGTGGFGGNKEMLEKYSPNYHANMKLGGLPLQGDGILMALESGAAADGMGMIMAAGPFGGGGTIKIGKGEDAVPIQVTFICGEPSVVWVNQQGRRFIDETASFNYYECINALRQQPGCLCYTLFDSATVRAISDYGFGNVPGGHGYGEAQRGKLPPGLDIELEKIAKEGNVKIAGSWEEIAEWTEIDQAVLKETIEEYNNCCDKGYDAVFLKDRRYLQPLRKPPYYAIKCFGVLLNTMGGIKINERMEVLDTGNNPIPGLYAAGVDTGGWTPDTYCAFLPGTAFGFAINSGRIAGENAGEYLTTAKPSLPRRPAR